MYMYMYVYLCICMYVYIYRNFANVWTVDPWLIPPKGRCNQLPVDTGIPGYKTGTTATATAAGNAHLLRMNFDKYPDIKAQCDDKIKFVMRTTDRQQRHGVYLTDFSKLNGTVTADSASPCPPPVKTTQKPCNVRLSETHNVSTECEGYISLDPIIRSGLIMFGPNNTLIWEYTTPALRTLVAPGRDSETLVFSCPWVQGGTTTHCLNGMFVRVKVNGCTVSCCGI